jgi:hypothetical protein
VVAALLVEPVGIQCPSSARSRRDLGLRLSSSSYDEGVEAGVLAGVVVVQEPIIQST